MNGLLGPISKTRTSMLFCLALGLVGAIHCSKPPDSSQHRTKTEPSSPAPASAPQPSRPVPAARDLEAEADWLAQQLSPIINRELELKQIPGMSIVVVEQGRTVWADGFGFADLATKRPATAATVYRVGSVSKVFVAIAAMQMVEQGQLDLDVPIQRYVPSFQPKNSFNSPITLRHLLSHRSGIVREPPVGSYFDATEPSLDKTLESLNATQVVYAPESRTKYSNAGLTVVGAALEKASRRRFARLIQDSIVKPLRLEHTSFERSPQIQRNLAKAYMWTREGRQFEAPKFAIGTLPAGNLYASMLDLGRFMNALLGTSEAPSPLFKKPDTIGKMLQPQYTDKSTGFGLGFAISRRREQKTARHGGAVYGFSTQMEMMVDLGLGVAVSANMDVCGATVRRIAGFALELLLARKLGQDVPKFIHTEPLESRYAAQLSGHFRANKEIVQVALEQGRPMLERRGIQGEIRRSGDSLFVDSRNTWREIDKPRVSDLDPVSTQPIESLTYRGQNYTRVQGRDATPANEDEVGLIGDYGWDYNVLRIQSQAGQLRALIEWHYNYPLTKLSSDVYAFPNYGMYHGEKLQFRRDKQGIAREVRAAQVLFRRRASPTRVSPSATRDQGSRK